MSDVIEFLKEERVILAAFTIGLLIRFFKTDTRLPLNVPKEWQIRFVAILGIAMAVVDKTSQGISFKQAIHEGLYAAAIAVFGHEVIIENIRKGKDVPLPLLMKPPKEEKDAKTEDNQGQDQPPKADT